MRSAEKKKPLPSPFVSFFAGAFADAVIEDVETLLEMDGHRLKDEETIRDVVATGRRVAREMRDNPAVLAIFKHHPTNADHDAVDALMDGVEKMNDVDGALSVGFMRTAIGLSRHRLKVALAATFMTHGGGYRVD